MAKSPPTGPWVRVHQRPALIRVVGALTVLALAVQVGAHLGVDAWLEQSLFAVAGPAPEATARGVQLWAVEVGDVSTGSVVDVQHILGQAAQYRSLAMAIAWTAAASAAAVWARVDARPIVEASCQRPAQPIALLAPAAV